MLQDIFRIYHLAPLVYLGCMKLDVPYNFSCIHIGWHWNCLWGTDRVQKNISQLQCGMWLVALPARGDHYSPLPILTGWLTCLFLFCDGFHGIFCNRWPPLYFLFYSRGICYEYLQVCKSFLDIFVSPSSVFLNYYYFLSPSLACLNYLEMISPSSVCLNSYGIIRILFSCELDRLEFAMQVIFVFRLGLKLPCLFPFLFYFSWILCLFVSCGPCAVSFLVLFGLIQFVGTWSFLWGHWCQMLVLFCLSHAYWCGPGRSHMDS